jgi:alkylated DNA repair dioxygenase AlkB
MRREATMNRHTDLRDGGTLDYDPAFLDKAEADALFARLREGVPWHQETIRGGPVPRLVAWVADPGIDYTYSRITHHGEGWPPLLFEVKRRVEGAAGAEFNGLLLNYYRHGQDSMGFHTDAEPELGRNPVIGSLSLGATRRFVLKHKAGGERVTLDLSHGSLLVMGGTCQHFWLHGLPKTKEPIGERINLTFRKILSGTPPGS